MIQRPNTVTAGALNLQEFTFTALTHTGFFYLVVNFWISYFYLILLDVLLILAITVERVVSLLLGESSQGMLMVILE